MKWRSGGPAAILAGAIALLSIFAVAGCELGQGPGQKGSATLVVTKDFGAKRLAAGREDPIRGGETVMRFLQRSARVKTSYGGGFVAAIDGLRSREGAASNAQVDWFYYVNGVEAKVGAAAQPLRLSDCVQWDYHDWSQAMRVPATVGCYPEPFLSGYDGRRLPTRINCGTADTVCEAVEQRLDDAQVAAGVSALTVTKGKDLIRVVVAPWKQLQLDPVAKSIGAGPRTSGVYAKFVGNSASPSLQLLDPQGRVVQTVGAGAGLVAATRQGNDTPVWVVTGTDASGVEHAVNLLDRSTLHDRFAVAIGSRGPIPVPLPVR